MLKAEKPERLNFRCRRCGSLDISFWKMSEEEVAVHPKCNFCEYEGMHVYDHRFRSEAHLRLEGDLIYWNQWMKGEHPTLPPVIGIYVKEPVHEYP